MTPGFAAFVIFMTGVLIILRTALKTGDEQDFGRLSLREFHQARIAALLLVIGLVLLFGTAGRQR